MIKRLVTVSCDILSQYTNSLYDKMSCQYSIRYLFLDINVPITKQHTVRKVSFHFLFLVSIKETFRTVYPTM